MNHIDTVRSALLDTLADLRDKKNPMDIARAKAVAEVAGVLVDTARVENEYMKLTKQNYSPFLDQPKEIPTAHSPFPVSHRRSLDDFESQENKLNPAWDASTPPRGLT